MNDPISDSDSDSDASVPVPIPLPDAYPDEVSKHLPSHAHGSRQSVALFSRPRRRSNEAFKY